VCVETTKSERTCGGIGKEESPGLMVNKEHDIFTVAHFKICVCMFVELLAPAAERCGLLPCAPCAAQGSETTEPSD